MNDIETILNGNIYQKIDLINSDTVNVTETEINNFKKMIENLFSNIKENYKKSRCVETNAIIQRLI